VSNETDPATPPADKATVTAEPAERVALADYKSSGKTLVRAKRGYNLNPSDLNLPNIDDEAGIYVTQSQADALLDELGGYLVIGEDAKE